ncbi:MAG: adenine nucleotide alpha hydrolase family protein [Prevotellaceae bacterium]|nr:adenine nucleotide alpha hydrolase family protein [Candidatus Minthosoma equi]
METVIQKLFNKGCVEYSLLEDGDRILIGLSGGKDSLMLTRLMAQRARIWKPKIEVEAAHVIMDNIPYESDIEYLHGFCNDLGIKLNVLHASFDESTDPRKTKCFLCAWNRRKTLFEYAVENGFNKIAFGHHNDDILTTLLMNMTFDGAFSAMPPKLAMQHYPLTIIRPLCLVHEKMIAEAAQELNFRKQKATCPYEEVTRRAEMQNLLNQLLATHPEARYSLWRSMMNIKAEQLPVSGGYSTTIS